MLAGFIIGADPDYRLVLDLRWCIVFVGSCAYMDSLVVGRYLPSAEIKQGEALSSPMKVRTLNRCYQSIRLIDLRGDGGGAPDGLQPNKSHLLQCWSRDQRPVRGCAPHECLRVRR